jgi:hypothetical protein
MSVNAARATAVVDAGLKAVSLDSGPPLADASFLLPPPASAGGPGGGSCGSSSGGGGSTGGAAGSGIASSPVVPEYKCAGDEHGLLLYPLPGALPALGPAEGLLPPRGALMRLQPGHCDPTVSACLGSWRGVVGRGRSWPRPGAGAWRWSGLDAAPLACCGSGERGQDTPPLALALPHPAPPHPRSTCTIGLLPTGGDPSAPWRASGASPAAGPAPEPILLAWVQS